MKISNGNNELDPGNACVCPCNVSSLMPLVLHSLMWYMPREFASWIEVDLRARATVAGSEGLSHAVFFLPGLASDYMNCTVPTSWSRESLWYLASLY